MKYLKVDWKHSHPHEPLEIFMELDDANMEIRKVHIYPDGHRERADTLVPDKDTEVSYEPVPSLDEINSDTEFDGQVITKEEFEEAWNQTREQKGP
ncbi:hypothetical protein SAMN02927900_05876 [Rhizobium mongolense subsp. loessense]|uniref:DUF6881 domain-containing protein n=1 Tax=Rhizobium mongolense subsp. loessense TaxID=158890 RepID=A0A1G4TZN7_9HYPH|nr:hypothetical protein [Rhizobium mongolense]SCW86821.1 hypothetical protein SAMN02927900_05876 [Rhizobium mongolense subsp. loessense]